MTAMTAPAQIDSRRSDQIRTARVLCILAVIYVHVPPYEEGLPASATSILGLIHCLRDVIGRSSVPLLSIVSGYLLARGLSADRRYGSMLQKKVRSLLLPLIAWNALFLGVLYTAGQERPDDSILDMLVGLTTYPALDPLYFLRDVFLCCLLSPLLVHAARVAPAMAMLILLLNAATNLDGLIFLNSAIPLFFAIGIILSDRRSIVRDLQQRSLAIGCTCLIALILIALVPFLDREWIRSDQGETLYPLLRLAARFAGAGLFWSLSGWILNHRTLAAVVQAYEPVIFFVFCVHPIVIGILWSVLQALGVTLGSAWHALFFLAAPLLVLIASVLAVAVLRAIAPGLLKLLMGGRVPSADQIAAMLRTPVAWRRSPPRRLTH